MATATFIHDGKSIDYTPGADVSAGDVVVQGDLIGIAKQPIAASVLGALAVTGIFDVVKAEEAFATVGGKVYWDADGDPYGGTAGTGAATATATGNTFLGFVLVAAAETGSTVRILLVPSAAAAESLGLGDLSDVGAVLYTAGRILVADGDSFEDVPVSGDATLAADGTVTLNDAHAEQVAIIRVEDLAAGADISARPVFVHPRAVTIVSVGILTEGAPADVDDSNTAVVALADDGSNEIVSKTYDTGTQPPSSDYEDLGTPDATHKALAAGEHVTLSVTQGTTADLPAFSVILRYIPTNAA